MIQKIKEVFWAVANWIWRSSADPAKISLTVRMAMIAVTAYVTLVSNTFGLPNLAGNYSEVIESMAKFVEAFFVLVGAAGAAFGAGRKVFLTVQRALQR